MTCAESLWEPKHCCQCNLGMCCYECVGVKQTHTNTYTHTHTHAHTHTHTHTHTNKHTQCTHLLRPSLDRASCMYWISARPGRKTKTLPLSGSCTNPFVSSLRLGHTHTHTHTPNPQYFSTR